MGIGKRFWFFPRSLSTLVPMSLAISLSFLSFHVSLYCLRRSLCSALRPRTANVGPPLAGKVGSSVVKVPRTINLVSPKYPKYTSTSLLQGSKSL